MSKNTGNTAFRKLNVNSDDEIDEDVGDAEVEGPNEGEVTALLNQYPFSFPGGSEFFATPHEVVNESYYDAIKISNSIIWYIAHFYLVTCMRDKEPPPPPPPHESLVFH